MSKKKLEGIEDEPIRDSKGNPIPDEAFVWDDYPDPDAVSDADAKRTTALIDEAIARAKSKKS